MTWPLHRQGAARIVHWLCSSSVMIRLMLSAFQSIIMRPSSLGGGRILCRTLSVHLSVRLSVRPVIVAIGNVFSSTASVTDVLFGTH